MKLSSAFDPETLMNGCTGKTSHVMDEVAAITEDRMSYMDKSGSMKAIENRQDMSDVTWSGIFNLSDEHGVNTIAYGSGGTIYGCYNYNNLNVASYSKSYAGNDIIDAAYAVGESVKTDGDGGDASSTSGGSSTFGVMVGISKDHIYTYNESRNSEGTVSKAWSLTSFDVTGGSGLDEDDLEFYRIFSAGRMFFVTSNQGVICFSASDVNVNIINLWEVLVDFPPVSMLMYENGDEASISAARNAAIQGIQFIRQKDFEFADRTGKISAYVVAWNIGTSNSLMSCVFLQNIDNQWIVNPILSNKNGTLSDIVPMSQMSFPSDVKTSIPSSSEYSLPPEGEDIKWINKEAISILPVRAVESSNEYLISENLPGINKTSLEMKTQNGFTILARNALASGNAMVENGPAEYVDDSSIPNIYSYISNTRKWKYEKPWIILQPSEPLPKHLEQNGLYWVAKSGENGELYSRWIENYEVERNPNAVDPQNVSIAKDDDFVLSDNIEQLFNDREESTKLVFDATSVLKDKIAIRKFVAIERHPSSKDAGIQFEDIEHSTSEIIYYSTLNSTYTRWNSTYSTSSQGTSIQSLVDYSRFASAPALPLHRVIERVYGWISYYTPNLPSTINIGSDVLLCGSTSFQSDSESSKLIFDLRINPNSETAFFDNTIHFRAGFYVIDKPEINFSDIQMISISDASTGEPINFKMAVIYTTESENVITDPIYIILYHESIQYSDESTFLIPSRVELIETDELEASGLIPSESSEFSLESIPKIKVETLPESVSGLKIQTSETEAFDVDEYGALTAINPYLISNFAYSAPQEISEFERVYELSMATQSTPLKNKSVARHYVYSSTGILSSNGSKIQGNRISCKLALANAIDDFAFSISNANALKIGALVPSELYAGNVIKCRHANQSKMYDAGLVKLVKNEDSPAELLFMKEWNDETYFTPIPWDGSDSFIPAINDSGDSFIVEIPTTKTVPNFLNKQIDAYGNITYPDTVSMDVILTLEISKAIVVDKINWNGQYKEYFQDGTILDNSQWYYLHSPIKDVIFTKTEANSGQPLKECSRVTVVDNISNGIKFTYNKKYGCKIPFNSENLPTSYEIASEDIHSCVLGDTKFFSATNNANGSLVVEADVSCLNFSDGIREFYQYTPLEEGGILRTYSIEETETGVWLLIKLENVEQMSDEWNNEAYISTTVTEHTPIIASIEFECKMFFIEPSTFNEVDETDGQYIQYHLREVDSNDAKASTHSNSIARYASIFLSSETDTSTNIVTNEKDKIVHLSSAGNQLVCISGVNKLCKVEYASDILAESLVETEEEIETFVDAPLEDIGTAQRISIYGNRFINLFTGTFEFQDGSLTPSSFNFFLASNYGKLEDALNGDLFSISGTTWKKFSIDSEENYRFADPVSKGSIPYIQYSELKQVQWDSSNPKKIVQWNTEFLSSGSFSLYSQVNNDSSLWIPATLNCDLSQVHHISSNGGWPEFYPSVGSIFNITEPHLTGAGTKYGVGRYIYIGDGPTLKECYAKLPYLDGQIHSTGISWNAWMNNQKQTFLMAVGFNNGVSFGKITKVSVVSSGTTAGALFVESTFDANFDSRPSNSFRVNMMEALPNFNCLFSAIVDSTLSKQKVYATITLDNFKIAIPEYGNFYIPRLSGLFTVDQSSLFGISDSITDTDISNVVNINSIMDGLQLSSSTSIISLSTRLSPGSKTETYPRWIWEASLVPYSVQTGQYNDAFVVGMSGLTTCIQTSTGLNVQTTKKYTYAKSLSKGSITAASTGRSGDSALPRIYPPFNDESIEEAEKEYVFYDEYGFYVKSSGATASSSSSSSSDDENAPKDMSGTDAMASMSKIIGMTTFKAYNAPIVVGLYEKGGLILYYGTRCFDRSILGTKRFVYGENEPSDSNTISPENIEDSFASYVHQRMLDTYNNPEKRNAILQAYLKGTGNIERAISLYAPEYSGNLNVINALTNIVLNKNIEFIPTEDETAALIEIEQAIIKEEERSLAEKEADENLIKAYEYSVNNSTESQWINIPIYVRKGNEYVEVDETLTSLTSSMAGGRIRLSVGTASGNVYWRDLNPLHADRYISYIPTGLLSQAEQDEIARIEEDEGNAELKKFLLGSAASVNSRVQTAKIGWTDWIWNYNGSDPVSGEIKYTARQSSKCISDNGPTKWLIANGSDIGMELTTNEANMVESSSTYAPYVRRRSWKWVLGGRQTAFSAYANEPEVRLSNGRLTWYLNGQSTGIAAVKGVYPRIVLKNNVKSWIIGENSTDIIGPVVENGRPYIQDRTWMILEHGKNSPTEIFTLDPKATIVQTIEKEKATDFWGINGRSIANFSTSEELTPITKFSTSYHPCWKFVNVLDDNGNLQESLPTSYSSKIGSCPFILEPQTIGVIDTMNEEPIWKSTTKNSFNESCVECDMFFVDPIGSTNDAYVRTVENSKSLRVHGILPEGEAIQNQKFYIAMSGKEWWLLPEPDGPASSKSRIGPYTSDAVPQSKIGTRWTCTRIVNNASHEWDSFDAPQNSNVEEKLIEETNSSTGETEYVKYWFINDINTELKVGHYTKPRLKCSIWKWTLAVGLKPIVQESSACPYKTRPEYCMWFNGTRAGDISYNIKDSQLYMDTSDSTSHWFVNGQDTGILCSMESENTSICTAIPPSNSSERWKFEWRVPDEYNAEEYILAATTKSCSNPLTQEKSLSWWMKDKNGNPVNTGIDAVNPLGGKGLESDGIASRLTSETYWNEEKKKYETIGPEMASWTPLASLFVDAYEETSYGVLESIKDPWSTSNPDIMKKGMAWEMISSEDLFGVPGVSIVDSQSTSWKAYEEGNGGKGNVSAPAFDVYIGWKNTFNRTDLYDSYCVIRSIETGATTKWTVSAKNWRFEHLELVVKSDGKLNDIVILSSKGWIASTNSISYANGGRDIKAIVWNDPVNPVSDVLDELEKIISFKWNAWESNEISEFAAVGSYGVYVYSPDCIRFTASIPYGEDAELIDLVWDPTKSEFKIWGVDAALDDDSSTNGKSTTIGKGSSGSEWESESLGSEEDFESSYEKNAVNASQGKSVSINALSEQTIYKHNHKRMDGEKETLYYQFSKATTSFDELSNVTSKQKENAVFIVADLPYKFSNGSKSYTYIYSKCKTSNKEVLGAGYLANQVSWKWMWSRQETKAVAKKMSYITVSENTRSVAYGFPDLKRFIKSYKELYSNSLEFVGSVCQFATSEKDSANSEGKSLKEAYEELVKVGGLKIYSKKLDIAWGIYKKAKKLRDNSHYAENDCYNTYLQKIGQSLALEYQDYFNRAKQAMWTAQAFKNYYAGLVAKGSSTVIQKDETTVEGSAFNMKQKQ